MIPHMTPDEARYYRASRAARAAWEATQPQLTLGGLSAGDETGPSDRVPGGRGEDRSPAASPSGLDDGPLTAGGETPYSPSGPTLSGTRTGAIIEPGQKEMK